MHCRITENAWENKFSKTDHGILCTPDLVYCFFEFISYTFQRESVKYINSRRISCLWNPVQTFEFRAILPWLPVMQLRAWTGLFPKPLVWYATVNVVVVLTSYSFISSIASPKLITYPEYSEKLTEKSQLWVNACLLPFSSNWNVYLFVAAADNKNRYTRLSLPPQSWRHDLVQVLVI